jgi:hypothetical protein
MTVSSITGTAQEQALSALRTAQEAVVTVLKPFAALSQPLFDNARVPFADQLPTPAEAIEQWYDFAGEALAAQKEFSLSLAGLWPKSSSSS